MLRRLAIGLFLCGTILLICSKCIPFAQTPYRLGKGDAALAERDAAIEEIVRALFWAWNREGATQDQIDHIRAVLAKYAKEQ